MCSVTARTLAALRLMPERGAGMAGHSATRSKGGWQPCQVQASRFFIEGYTPTGGPHPQSQAVSLSLANPADVDMQFVHTDHLLSCC